jgi:hypothetical protein
MYSIGALFQKQPAAIAGAIRAVLLVLVLAKVIALDIDVLAGGALALEVVLGLFVYSQSTSQTYPNLKEGTEVRVQGSEDKVIIEKSPPGPTGIEDG